MAKRQKVDIRIQSTENTTVIGIQEGPNEEMLRAVLREELEIFARSPVPSSGSFKGDRIAQSVFVCESGNSSSLGFSVNNSGLIICLRSIGEVEKVVNLATSDACSASHALSGDVLQCVEINTDTTGIVPAYKPADLAASLWAFDMNGSRSSLTLDFCAARMRAQVDSGGSWFLTDLLGARQERAVGRLFGRTVFNKAEQLIGGPVFNKANEVVGLCIARSHDGLVFIRPWSSLERCIDLEAQDAKH